jgi:dGTPase
MADDFYCAFDRDCLSDEFNSQRKHDYRSVFHQDRDRLMFTGSFRRLQAKTQVFQAGEYDFYRTRLTHSLEVSRIADSIAVWLRVNRPEFQVDLHLLEGICLAHDIGHPPFGHAGERVLNELMTKYGGFEGNAQTLRILTRTIYSSSNKRSGMSPSRAMLDGVLKYKRLYRDRGDDTNHFIYSDQAEMLEFCLGTADLSEKLDPKEINHFQSVECQIMDLADDVAYSCFDILDGVKARFITTDKMKAWRDENEATMDAAERKVIDELLGIMAKGGLQRKMNGIIGELIQMASMAPAENFMTPQTRRYAYTLVRGPEAKTRIKLYKKLASTLVYGSSALRQIEFKGGHILRKLANTFFDNYLESVTKPTSLLPEEVHRSVLAAKSKPEAARLLCDHLSGMTDAYALRSYKRLLDPDYGSISELI